MRCGPRGPHGVWDLSGDGRRDGDEVQVANRMVNRHLPALDGILGVAEQLAHERSQLVPTVEGRPDLAVGRIKPVRNTQGRRGSDVGRLLARRGHIETQAPLALQTQHALVDHPDAYESVQHLAVLVTRQAWLALGMRHFPVVVHDPDDFQLHVCTGGLINARRRCCQAPVVVGDHEMESAKTLKPRDVLSYLGRDYVIEGVVVYKVNGKTYPLARAVDGDVVLWVEPLMDDMDDRLLLLTEVRDLDIGTPPPASISPCSTCFLCGIRSSRSARSA